jgi:hypothetical protein
VLWLVWYDDLHSWSVAPCGNMLFLSVDTKNLIRRSIYLSVNFFIYLKAGQELLIDGFISLFWERPPVKRFTFDFHEVDIFYVWNISIINGNGYKSSVYIANLVNLCVMSDEHI